jgi:hypothetical protein
MLHAHVYHISLIKDEYFLGHDVIMHLSFTSKYNRTSFDRLKVQVKVMILNAEE